MSSYRSSSKSWVLQELIFILRSTCNVTLWRRSAPPSKPDNPATSNNSHTDHASSVLWYPSRDTHQQLIRPSSTHTQPTRAVKRKARKNKPRPLTDKERVDAVRAHWNLHHTWRHLASCARHQTGPPVHCCCRREQHTVSSTHTVSKQWERMHFHFALLRGLTRLCVTHVCINSDHVDLLLLGNPNPHTSELSNKKYEFSINWVNHQS